VVSVGLMIVRSWVRSINAQHALIGSFGKLYDNVYTIICQGKWLLNPRLATARRRHEPLHHRGSINLLGTPTERNVLWMDVTRNIPLIGSLKLPVKTAQINEIISWKQSESWFEMYRCREKNAGFISTLFNQNIEQLLVKDVFCRELATRFAMICFTDNFSGTLCTALSRPRNYFQTTFTIYACRTL
jgi:hypothetical protein